MVWTVLILIPNVGAAAAPVVLRTSPLMPQNQFVSICSEGVSVTRSTALPVAVVVSPSEVARTTRLPRGKTPPPSVTIDPGICGGEPTLTGHRIRLFLLAGGVAIDGLEKTAAIYHLDPAAVREALVWWEENKPQETP